MADEENSLESKQEIPAVQRWKREIDLSEKRDKNWLKEGRDIFARFRNEGRHSNSGSSKDHFNILWANTEVQRPALYSRTPRPDIRRRFTDKSPGAAQIVELLERAASFTMDASEIDDYMIAAVNDVLLPGRGTVRPKYVAHFADEEQQIVDYEEVIYEQVQWDELLLGPGKTWDELPWMAFKQCLSKEDVAKIAPDYADHLTYDEGGEEYKSEQDKKEAASIDQKAIVWEIWCKESKERKWYAPSYPDALIRVDEPPIQFKHFWPIPRPMYCIESTTSLLPVTEFSQYEKLADELEDVTVRMGRLTRSLRARGIYDSTLSELARLFEAGDNEMIPAENISRLMEKGLSNAIWMYPNGDVAQVLMELYKYRSSLIQQIYELTGISDILRGSTNPHETLGAQQMKANFGSQRLSKKQSEVQRFARDLVRLTVEIIAEQFSPDTLSKMTGIKFPYEAEKIQMQHQMQQQQQMAVQQGQQPPPPPPEVQKMMTMPTWEQVLEVLHSDLLREYRVDIETDSTIEADQTADQNALSSLMQGISQFAHGIAPLIESGVMSKEGAKQTLISMFRRYRLGREVEEAIMESGPEEQKPEDQAQQVEQMKVQAEMEAIKMKMQADQQEAQNKQAILKMEMEREQAAHQQKMMSIQADMERDRQKFQMQAVS